jgi:hypothetical protein
MPRITNKQILEVATKLKVNIKVATMKILKAGIKVELEHGTRYPKTNITNDNLEMTMKIVLAHLYEGLNYYNELEIMEKKLEKQWKGKRKPNIFLK